MTGPTIEQLKVVYRIPAAWRDLDFQGQPGKTCNSPWREDRHPSFSVFNDGMRWRDFATGEAGDVLDFIARARNCDTKTAVAFVEERLGIVRELKRQERRPPAKWPELRRGTLADLEMLTGMRGFGVGALLEAEQRGFLYFGTHWNCGFWGVTDVRRKLIELRRISGESWRAYGRLRERKAHCLGSGKEWPVGILESESFPKIAFVEGAPDFIAAIHFAQVENCAATVAPVGMLGAGAGRIAADALPYFRGKHVRLFPHLDAAGCRATRLWAGQIVAAGAARVDAFDFSGLYCQDDKSGKDLADVCLIRPDCFEDTRKFWRMLP